MIHLAVICGGRAIPLLWKVIEHESATVAFDEYKPMLHLAHKLLADYPDMMLLGDRAFACHELRGWLQNHYWHYALRLKMDVALQGIERRPVTVADLLPKNNQATFFRNVGLWSDGLIRTNLVLATSTSAKESWAVITDEEPSLNTLWQYGLRFCIEELFIVASIERICPDQAEWLEQCESLSTAGSLTTMVWIALQMGLWLAREILEAELKQRAQQKTQWSKCKECGHKMQSKGWRKRQMETIVGTVH